MTDAPVHRRTVLAAAAWTVPAVAIATGIPIASASITNITVFNNNAGETAQWRNPEDTLEATYVLGARPSILNQGLDDLPAGVRFDIVVDDRVVTNIVVAAPVLLTLASTTTVGNATTYQYTTAVAVPAGGSVTFNVFHQAQPGMFGGVAPVPLDLTPQTFIAYGPTNTEVGRFTGTVTVTPV